jgi:Protein of unknown function (DUF429)
MYGGASMTVLGIDLAASNKKTYACVLQPVRGELHAEVHAGCDDDELLDLAKGRRKVALDAPFGWPNDFVDALNAHRAGAAWPAPDDQAPQAFRASLSFRATDRAVMQIRRPLSVSTDRLGVTAMRCAFLLHRWSATGSVDRTGRGRFVEVYPAAALVRWGLSPSRYKKPHPGSLGTLFLQLCEKLPALRVGEPYRTMCATVDHAFDALVAALVARAALLGMTDGPPKRLRDQAAGEGWIHVPLRGSLRFLNSSKTKLIVRPEPALAAKLHQAAVDLDDKGYAKRIEDVLLPTLSEKSRKAIKKDLQGKGGSELVRRKDGRTKFFAAHSSAALAANTFAPLFGQELGIPIAGKVFTGEAHLEVECPTGLRGTPPTLDCVIKGDEVLAVESKCIETFDRHVAAFKSVYRKAIGAAHETWQAEYERLVENPLRYRYLDAAQLIRHYLGLRTTHPDRPVTLAYLYWAPTNCDDIAPCVIHAEEVRDFRGQVADPAVQFIGMPYTQLWADWASPDQPTWLRDHAAMLRDRYKLPVSVTP